MIDRWTLAILCCYTAVDMLDSGLARSGFVQLVGCLVYGFYMYCSHCRFGFIKQLTGKGQNSVLY